MQPSPVGKIFQRYLSRLYQCVKTDPSIAVVLSTEIPNVQYTSESVLLVGIQNAVHDNHENLQLLGSVLQQLPGATAKKLGSDLINEYGKIDDYIILCQLHQCTCTMQLTHIGHLL